MHNNIYIYLHIKRSSLGDSFVPYLSAFPFRMVFRKRFDAPTLPESTSPFDNCVSNPPSQSSETYSNACGLLLDLFKNLLNALQPGLTKHQLKYRCCATRDLVYGRAVRSTLSLKTKTLMPNARRVLAWRNLDKFYPALISFFSPFKRYLPSSHTEVTVLKTQPSKERIK
jgi:hypothetical protein